MSAEFDRQDQALLEAVDCVARGDERGSETMLEREVTELLALLPYELEPVTPRPELREGIRDRIAGTTVVPFPERAAAPPLPSRPTSSGRAVRLGMLAMAAVLALCLVGLGHLLARTEQQQATIAELTQALATTDARLAEMARARDRLDMITRVAQHVYPMRPARPAAELRRAAFGKVFVCGEHQQWYLNIQRMEPPPPGHEYCLWFVTAEGMVPGGAVKVRDDGVAELAARSMPAGTRGFAVTLEVENSHSEEPQGDVMLLSDAGVSL